MNAAMLHQRVLAGRWLGGRKIATLSEIKASPDAVKLFRKSWQSITRVDFLPVIDPAITALEEADATGLEGGLVRALRHIAEQAEGIAEAYADMGTDHAGELFNKVMGDQASDGAFFTKPVAADLAARMAVDAIDPENALDWSHPDTWLDHVTVDPACGSGTLLAATMAEMKRRAKSHGADIGRLAELQKVAVEETLVGLDINPISMQLAASQLMAGNVDVGYRKMKLHLMPYGPDETGGVAAGSIELFGRSDIVNAGTLFDDSWGATRLETGLEFGNALRNPEMDDVAKDVKAARIVIMNPPFTNRKKMGDKFDDSIQIALRNRIASLENLLNQADSDLHSILDVNTIRQHFTSLADLCLDRMDGVLVMVLPTTAMTSASKERLLLAERFHVHTILTVRQARDVNLSQHTAISESVVVLKRHDSSGLKPSTRIVTLDRLPTDVRQCDDLWKALRTVNGSGAIAGGWGEISYWSSGRIATGDWTAVIWRSPELARAASRYAEHGSLRRLDTLGLRARATGQLLLGDKSVSATVGEPGVLPVIRGKGEDSQKRTEATITEWRRPCGGRASSIQKHAGHLLVTTGQDTSTARLNAVASCTPHVGIGWYPIVGCDLEQASALTIFLNSTIGRLVVMRSPGRKISFPEYSVIGLSGLPVPDIHDETVLRRLAACWRETRQETVPQYRDGYTDIRRVWDGSVCDALGWSISEVSEIGKLLHEEPHVKGIAYGQWK